MATISVDTPHSGSAVTPDDAVAWSGAASNDVLRVRLRIPQLEPLDVVHEADVIAGRWAFSSPVPAPGAQAVVIDGLDGSSHVLASAQHNILVLEYDELIPIPSGINHPHTRALPQTMLDLLGRPGELTEDCSAVTNAGLRALMVTRNVGPFSVTGVKPAVEALSRIFARVRAEKPVLFSQLASAGMLCCRRVKVGPGLPPSNQYSNHSWGSAIDLKILGTLDPRGDGKTQRGLAQLAPYFNAEGFFWGAGFSGSSEDAMHFEVSEQTIRDWKQSGLLG